LRVGIAQGLALDDVDEIVSAQFESAVRRLGQAGVNLSDAEFSLFEDMARVQSVATIATAEAWRIHREHLATRGADYDPRVRSRIEMGSAVSDADHAVMLKQRGELVSAMDLALAEFDALVLPTTPIIAPTMAEISTREGFKTANRLLLRNTAIANFFDLCAISLPIHGASLPSGLMLFARRGQDRRLFNIAAAVEGLLAG
jgi:aspartyl-tRNA(Asn)/glutamyl-tRNA(Gln) amidotransferase subunit A